MSSENSRPPVAVISGGLGDIGRAIASELARQGADIAIGDIRPARDAAALVAELKNLGRQARYDRVDIADERATARWLDRVETSLGTPTWIIPNAAIVTVGRLPTLTAQQWQRELSINLNGAFYLAHNAALKMVARGQAGRIVFIGSWAGDVAHPNIPTYCVSKAGLRMLAKLMAIEYAPHDILVNEVAPGYVNGGLSGRLFDRDRNLRNKAIKRVPIGKLIEPAEVAREVAHLCDPQTRQLTGSVVLMDGGLSLRDA